MRTGSIDDALHLLEKANQRLKQMATNAGEEAAEATGRALWMSKKAAKRIDRSAHDNAWKFVGATAALAALAGFYCGRAMRE